VNLADALSGLPASRCSTRPSSTSSPCRLPGDAAETVESARRKGVLGGVPASRLHPGAGFDDLLIVATTELNTDDDRAALVAALKEVCNDHEPTGPPDHSTEISAPTEAQPTFTGNRALMQEEALIFETGRLDMTGVDLDEPDEVTPRLGNLVRNQPPSLPGLTEPEAMRHYVRL
jgi:hypothetical protein